MARISNICGDRRNDVATSTVEMIRRATYAIEEYELSNIRRGLKNLVGYPTEIVPISLDAAISELMNMATDQWARASRELLIDVYSSSSKKKYLECELLARVIQTSPQFAPDLLGWEVPEEFPWDYSLSMDWQMRRANDGSVEIDIIELNSGSVGGLERSSFVASGMREIWGHLDGFGDVRWGEGAAEEMIRCCSERAAKMGGISVNYQENDHPHIFGEHSSHVFRSWLEKNNVELVSGWNSDKLIYRNGFYYFGSQKVTSFWLQYYPSAVDHSTLTYVGLGDIYKNEFEMEHHIRGFWGNYFQRGGFERWHVFNPLGVELLSDKGLLTCFNEIIEMYLGESPIVPVDTYSHFFEECSISSGQRVCEIFSERENYVIKSRVDNREGLGVVVGRNCPPGPDGSFQEWSDLRNRVNASPDKFVAQKYLAEPTFESFDGLTRSFEVRNLAWLYGDQVHCLEVPYVRSGVLGNLRNLSQVRGTSVVPICIG